MRISLKYLATIIGYKRGQWYGNHLVIARSTPWGIAK